MAWDVKILYHSFMIANLVAVLMLLAAIYFLGRPIVHGAIFFPTTTRNVETMIALALLRAGDKIVDLGSGDGRIVIACAKRGIRAEGYEINPILVLLSRRAIRRAGVQDLAVIHWKSFWRANLAPFNVIFVYGIPYIMSDLRKKLERELKSDTRVVSHVFQIPQWISVEEREKVYLYKIPKSLHSAQPQKEI